MKDFLQQNKWLLVLVVLAACFRFYLLGILPAGITWDEAAIGYNGYGIVTTRRDEWLERLPISFRSFGDYKAPLAIYLTGIFTFIFGLTPFVVRLPFALSGVAAVVVFYFLALQFFEKLENKNFYSLVATFFLTFSPWHIHFTRVGFESGLALTLTLLGLLALLLFFKMLDQGQKWFWSAGVGCISGVLFVTSLYTYHSSKIVVPLLVLVTILLFGRLKVLLTHWNLLLIPVVITILAVWPLVSNILYGQGGARASVLIFSEKLSLIEYTTIICQNFALHVSPSFLLNGATNTLRHSTGVWGVLFVTTYGLGLVGLLGYFTSLLKRDSVINLGISAVQVRRISLWGILVIIIGLLPAVLTREVPHPNRALFTLPGFLVLATMGLYYLMDWLSTFSKYKEYFIKHTLVGTLLMVHVLLFASFWNYYLNTYPSYSTDAFQEGYIEAFTIAKDYEKGENGKREVEKILFSSEYGQPYIYALFVRKTNPIWYRGGSLIKYEFTDSITEGDLERNNTLVVTTQNTILKNRKPDHLIYAKDGSVRFALYLTKAVSNVEVPE